MYNKNKIAATLAIMAMLGFLVMFAALGFAPVPPENKDFFNMGFIALIGFTSTAFGYYLGSSLGSAQKNELIARSTPGRSPDKGSGEGLASEAGFINLRCLVLFLVASLLLCASLLFTGCATTSATAPPTATDTPQVRAGKSLLAVQTSIVTAARATDGLCRAGTLKADICAQAKAAYQKTKPAYDLALDAYLLMSAGGGDPADFESALLRVQNMAANLLLIVDDSQTSKGGAK
ncbi:MAG: hypothetical protein WA003_08670 [Desulfuromonadaceae bacterium]